MSISTKLTVVALAWKETDHLEKCFQSLVPLLARTGATTLVVLNEDADPATRQLALRIADRVIEHPFTNFSRQRNIGLDAASTEWVFFIDPDERSSEALAFAIERAIVDTTHAAYRVPRRNILFGKEVKHTGWWPDYQVRLLLRANCRYDESIRVHELPTVEGTIGTLSPPLVHYNYSSWRQFVSKQIAYSKLEAEALWGLGRRVGPRSVIGQPLRELKRRLIDYEGYKDGVLGTELSFAMAAYSLMVQRELLRLQRQRDSRHE